MAYSTTILRRLRIPLSVFNKLRLALDLDVKDISLYNVILDVRDANRFEERFVATASQTAFTIAKSLPAPSGNIMPVTVYRNSSKLKWVASGPAVGQFTYSGNVITVSSSTVNDNIEVNY